jgi:hypothetical protein
VKPEKKMIRTEKMPIRRTSNEAVVVDHRRADNLFAFVKLQKDPGRIARLKGFVEFQFPAVQVDSDRLFAFVGARFDQDRAVLAPCVMRPVLYAPELSVSRTSARTPSEWT